MTILRVNKPARHGAHEGAIALLAATALVTIFSGPAAAQAPPPPRVEWAPAPLEYRGCYYYRGRERCGRYCYLEVNGKRYCQQRRREAFPQASLDDFFVPEPRPYAYRPPGYRMK
jgi:hypothetical protein